MTKLVPVVTKNNTGCFVSDLLVPPQTITLDGVQVETAPLKMGQEVDLLSVSIHPALIGAGVMDISDSLAPNIALEKIYLALNSTNRLLTEVFEFNITRKPDTALVKSAEGNHREMVLRYVTECLTLDAYSKTIAGETSTTLAPLADRNLRVRLRASVNGVANLETGLINVHTSSVELLNVYEVDSVTEDGLVIPLTDETVKNVSEILGEPELIGYTLDASVE